MRLVAAQMDVTAQMKEFLEWGAVRVTDTPFSPVVDGEVLHPRPVAGPGVRRGPRRGAAHRPQPGRVPAVHRRPGRLGQITDARRGTVLDYFAPAPDGPARYRKAYPGRRAGGLFELVFSDWLFRMPTLHLAQAHAMSGGTTYLYELSAAGARRPAVSAPATRSTSRWFRRRRRGHRRHADRRRSRPPSSSRSAT